MQSLRVFLPDAGFLLDFARRVFLDLLFLLERRFTARLAEASLSSAPLRVSDDPLSELLCAVMDALDGTGGTYGAVRCGALCALCICFVLCTFVGRWLLFVCVCVCMCVRCVCLCLFVHVYVCVVFVSCVLTARWQPPPPPRELLASRHGDEWHGVMPVNSRDIPTFPDS